MFITLITDQVKKCGIDFRWNMFGMTVRDADNLAMGLRICRKLRKIKIYNSKIDDDRFYAVFDGMKNLPCMGNLLVNELRFPIIVKNRPSPASFSFIFGLLKQTIHFYNKLM